MTFRILVVCSANLCRSPLAAAAMSRSLAQLGLEGRITVDSRGIAPPPGRLVCPEVVRLAQARGLHSLALPRHVAQAVTADEVEAADLVLASDRRVRSDLVKRVPHAGGRMFTLREAAELGDTAAAEVRGRPFHDRLASFASAMNASRGLTDLPRTRYVVPLPTPWRRVPVHTHDIPDAHEAERAPHRVVYQLTVAAAERVTHHLCADTSAVSW